MNKKITLVWLCLALIMGSTSLMKAAKNDGYKSLLPVDTLKNKPSVEKEMRDKIRDMNTKIDSMNKEFKRLGLDYKMDAMIDTPGSKKYRFEDGIFHMNIGDLKAQKDGAETDNDPDSKDSMGLDIPKKLKKLKFKRYKAVKDVKTQILGLDLGVNTFMNSAGTINPTADPSMELDLPISTNVVLHLIRQGVNIYKHNLYIVYGLAYDWNNYKFKNAYTIQPNVKTFTSTYSTGTDSGIKFSRNKLVAEYLTVPVMLHIESNPFRSKRSFDIGVGGFGGMRVNSYTKQISDKRGTQKIHDDFNLNPFRYGVSAQVGYGILNFYANYALSELFDKNQGPKVTPINFGIVLNGFNW
ncbi:MAG: outer membrane beta-barrel protein [Bacteroidetes bacterium]|nr:outer membrane beta-barrel protein [Bacteroidota bacterium]